MIRTCWNTLFFLLSVMSHCSCPLRRDRQWWHWLRGFVKTQPSPVGRSSLHGFCCPHPASRISILGMLHQRCFACAAAEKGDEAAVGQAHGQQSASSKELVVEQPVTPLDTISGADARLVLDAPFYYHWPSGEPACRGLFFVRWAVCAWVAAPCCSQYDPRRLLCSRRLARAPGRPDLAENSERHRVNTRQGRSATMNQQSCIRVESWRFWFTALCTLVTVLVRARVAGC